MVFCEELTVKVPIRLNMQFKPLQLKYCCQFLPLKPYKSNTLRLLITRSPHGSQIYFQCNMCENVSTQLRYTQCKLWKSYSLYLTPVTVNLPRGGVNESLNIQCLRNRGSCVINRRLSNFCLQNNWSTSCKDQSESTCK